MRPRNGESNDESNEENNEAMKMKKLINDPFAVSDELVEGFMATYADGDIEDQLADKLTGWRPK
jgi:hypothetical protein